MQKDILKVIEYFSFFQYPPTFEEIHTFYPKKIAVNKLQKEINRLIKKKKIILLNKERLDSINHKLLILRYTLGEYGIKVMNSCHCEERYQLRRGNPHNEIASLSLAMTKKKYNNSLKKIEKIHLYLKLLSFFPQIKLVGLSGTVAMMNAKKNDDIDLFIITAKNRLWTGRLIAISIAKILGIKRNRVISHKPLVIGQKDKVCLNLFFDEKKMEVPDHKKTEYVAHEILQMKPLINKDNTYQRFLRENKWVYKLFPNAKSVIFVETGIQCIKNYYIDSRLRGNDRRKRGNDKGEDENILANIIEKVLKNLQLKLIKSHQTSEIITNSQLWFFPEDFEAKMKKAKIVKL